MEVAVCFKLFFYKLSYKTTDNSTITPLFSPTFGTINGALTLNRLSNAPTISNKPSGLSIGQTGIDFELLLANSAINNKGKTTTDLTPLIDGPVIKGGISSTSRILIVVV